MSGLIKKYTTLVTIVSFLVVGFGISLGRIIAPGETLAYVRHEDGAYGWNIIIHDLNRNLTYNLTDFAGMQGLRSRLPNWSPDGSKLAFISENDSGLDAFLAEQATVKRLTNYGEAITGVDWSPDSMHVVVDLRQDSNGRHLYVINIADGKITSLVPPDDVERRNTPPTGAQELLPEWLPNGEIAYVRSFNTTSDLYLIRPGVTAPRQITQNMVAIGYLTASPDGKQIAFAAIDLNTDAALGADIFVLNPTTNQMNAAMFPGPNSNLVWSSDGRYIAFVSSTDGDDEIFLITMPDLSVRKLTDNQISDSAPAWSSDGQWLAFSSVPRFQGSAIYIIRPDGTGLRQITDDHGRHWSPVWKPLK